MDTTSDERVCYVHCNFCNTILVVSIPCTSMLNTTVLTVRCGHCANFLYVNMQPTLPHPQPVNLQKQSLPVQDYSMKECGSSSKCTKASLLARSAAPLKRQRVPSAYNRFIKEEIQRIKANNPTITHKEAFSTAAKNWAHFPQMQFGLGNSQ